MSEQFWDTLVIALSVPVVYLFTSNFPLLSAFIISSVLVKN
jgi:hypothetical protein